MTSYNVFEINTFRKRKHCPIPQYRTFTVVCRTQQRALDFLFLKHAVGRNEILTCRKVGEHDF